MKPHSAAIPPYRLFSRLRAASAWNANRRLSLVSFLLMIFGALVTYPVHAGEGKTSATGSRVEQVLRKTLGKDTRIIRLDAPEKSPVEGWTQTRVWIESAYGETPVLFYSTGDGKFIFAGSIFDSKGENLTRRDVGETKPRAVELSRMDLNDDYMAGKKDAAVKAVLWLDVDPYSRELFESLYALYERNPGKVALYIKFYPRNETGMEKLKALTCFRGEALLRALQTVYEAVPGWGSKEHLDALKKTADPNACSDLQIEKDWRTASDLKLWPRPTVFVNGVLLAGKATRENVERVAGVKLE